MLRLLALSAALAGATVQVDLPELFADELARVSARTDVPVLLPQRMPVDEDLERHTSGFGGERRWGLQLASAPDCGGATACFTASFAGRRGGRPFGRRTVRLAGGRTGRFTPLSCGASCAPPRIEWRMRGATYSIQAVVGTRRTERRILVRMANSAIRNGPRSG
jgi:hypothetical protein